MAVLFADLPQDRQYLLSLRRKGFHPRHCLTPHKKSPVLNDLTPGLFVTATIYALAAAFFFWNLSRKSAIAGSSHIAPTMFQTNMKVSRMPMSARNLMSENAQVPTHSASDTAVKVMALCVGT